MGDALPLPPSVQEVTGHGGLRRFDVATPAARASVYAHGAHVTGWQPVQEAAPVLWLSPSSVFAPGKAIRGGIPICLPWFGPNGADPAAPSHGFARLTEWTLAGASEGGESDTTLTFELQGDTRHARPHGPASFTALYRVGIGARLRLELEVRNVGEEPFTFEEALHTYFAVGEIGAVSVEGLAGASYLDKVRGFARFTEPDEQLRFAGETDRVYHTAGPAHVIHDRALQRHVRVRKANSASTIVWNPGPQRARELPDFGDDEWRRMLCVETGNVRDAAVRLEPGGVHVLATEIIVERT